MKVAVLFLTLAVCCLSQKFECDFSLTTTAARGGFVEGKLKYDWEAGNILFFFPHLEYSEYTDYVQSTKGYGGSTEDQFFYRWGDKVCPTCETSQANEGMPVFFLETNQLQQSSSDAGIITYSPKNAPINPCTEVKLTTDGVLVSATFKEGRQFTFSNCNAANFPANTFSPPDNCKCGKKLDIVLVLDRSGSISREEFVQEKTFVQQFAAEFEYGEFGANLGITNFNRETWDGPISLHEGITKDVVTKGTSAMQCSGHSSCTQNGNGCCCCGTAVSSGIRNGADMLAKSTRADAKKILITLTDGYHNRVFVGKDSKDKPQGKTSTCKTTTECNADLSDSVEYAKSVVPGLVPFAIAVGVDRNALVGQLEIIADNDASRVITAADFDSLPSIVDELVKKTCDNTIVECGPGCCGFCACGKCTPVTGCPEVNFCDVVDVVDACCVTKAKDPNTCDETDKCFTYKCNRTSAGGKGACEKTAIPIKPNSTCESCVCVDGLEVCTDLCPQLPDCVNDTVCIAGGVNLQCRTYFCVINDTDPLKNFCNYTTKPDTECDDDNQCTLDKCEANVGCVHTPHGVTLLQPHACNDDNECTIDECDPFSTNATYPCTHTPINCSDTDVCHNVTCDSTRGCQESAVLCPSDGNCTISGCEAENNTGCYFREEDCGAVPIGAIAGIAAGVIAGIVIAAIAGALLFGGGAAVAYTQGGGAPLTTAVSNNPIYSGQGSSTESPIFKV